ncbi:MAG: hypothetical protein IT580_21080 [Verrucomicrobiales bacterium]|nr:hypothetical protein [Verrucomicrobiales bacterium]
MCCADWRFLRVLLASLLFTLSLAASAGVRVRVEHLETEVATREFELKQVPRPVTNDAATEAAFRVVQGRGDPNGGDLGVLHDGRLPGNEDAPRQAFFFAAGSTGGRILVDLQGIRSIAQVNTYSWHAGERGPQVYTLFAAAGTEPGFTLGSAESPDPDSAGWTRVAIVDTRPSNREQFGGQHAVSVADTDPATDLGRFRYLLFVVQPTHASGPFAQTFLGEIDVIDRQGPPPEPVKDTGAGGTRHWVELDGGETRIVVDDSGAPDLASWIEAELMPMIREWYPEIRRLLASPGFEAPRRVTIVFEPEGEGVAATSGSRVTCWTKWFRANLQGEAKGAVLHELVHVVQQYGRAPRAEGRTRRPPGWLVEGIPDYIRWFRYEPRTGGALLPPEAASRVRYDASYRVSANFLNWVTTEYGPQVVRELNAAMREGRYRDELWPELTGRAAAELGEAWKADLARQRSR